MLKSKTQISWLDDVDEKGNIINPNSDIYGKNITGEVLEYPSASGSTVGSDRIVNLARRGHAPKKIIIEKVDPITIWGALLGRIEIEIKGKEKKAVDASRLEKLGVENEIAEMLAHAGEVLGTDEFIKADYVQIAGVSYKTITETGLELRRYFGEKYRFRAKHVTINPAGMDMLDWKSYNVPESFARKQEEIIEIYMRMGAKPTITCTPYLVSEMPEPFTDVFMSESSVVAYLNSVMGIRTNRESGLSTLLYAIAGYGPRYGLHLKENREPRVELDVETELKGMLDFTLLGYAMGELSKGRVPYIRGIKGMPTLEEFKTMGAAGAASGSIDLYHIEGVTPEAKAKMISLDNIEEKITVTREMLNEIKEKLNTGKEEEINLVTFGCPHASLEEIKEIAGLLAGKKVRQGVELWVCTSRAMKEKASELGLVKKIESAGGHVVADTCMVVSPIEEMGYATTATNSGKAAKYLPRFCKQNVVFDTTEGIIGKIVEK